MDTPKEHTHHPESSKSKVWIFFAIGGALLFLLVSSALVYAKSYEDRTLPGLHIGDISIGKMTDSELHTFLDTMVGKLSSEGLEFQLRHTTGTEKFVLFPELVGESELVEYVSVDTQKETQRLLAYGKSGNLLLDSVRLLESHLTPRSIQLESVSLNQEVLLNTIQQKTAPFETPPVDARLSFTSFAPVQYTVLPSAPGNVFDYQKALDQVEQNWKQLQNTSLVLEAAHSLPRVKESDFDSVIDRVESYFALGPIELEYQKEGEKAVEWQIPVSTYANWLTVSSSEANTPILTLETNSSTEYLETEIAPDLFIEPQNAKFSIREGGKVQEFQASRVGRGLDVEATLLALKQEFQGRANATSSVVQVVVSEVEPDVATGEVNDLGISEVLGVGISNFSGSPLNRIKNIRNAVEKLNGILIKPGDEFSAIRYTEPYTIEGGYLPEKVIKGDEIKPEIGGGLCQVGTTLFRMAMNSGMEITERRNHSLVVNYYNDLSNGLPGTDATIYDPAPDFRFKNDTEHYILIETDMNVSTGELKFTLWGTSDGRKASYSKPVVHQWASPGPARMIETTKLAPGAKECQSAFRGATASFTYTIELPDGTKKDRVFESYYRPLPQICLVGVSSEPKTSCEEGEVCESTEEETAEGGASEEESVSPPEDQIGEKPSVETAPFAQNS